MRFTISLAAAAAALAAALPALAESPSAAETPSAESRSAPASATAAAALSVGQQVKDKTGAVIGQIVELKPGGAGQTATVKMGDQSFVVGAESLVVQDGAAVINATEAELKAMVANAQPG